MPATRNRTQVPNNLRARHRSLDGSTTSIPSEEFDSADEDISVPDAMNRGSMAAMLAGYRTLQVRGEEGEASRGDFMNEQEGEEEEQEYGVDDGEGDQTDVIETQSALPPRGLKEISSLASWTVSTSKPGCGVAALRSPDTSLFWQSDGPQPHLLSIHFFKLVSIAHMRIFLDFDNDESYTPTKMQFLAGMGVHDVQEFCEMTFEQPRGWIDVDFSQVGPVNTDDEEAEQGEDALVNWENRAALKCFLVQVRILENHQNGKDTHLRGLQIFARDERAEDGGERGDSLRAKSHNAVEMAERPKASRKKNDGVRMRKASWMMEPELR